MQTCTQLPALHLALMMLRLLFRGASCPLEWGTILESVSNLNNAILQHNDWDLLTLFAAIAQASHPRKSFQTMSHLGPDKISLLTSQSMQGASPMSTSSSCPTQGRASRQCPIWDRTRSHCRHPSQREGHCRCLHQQFHRTDGTP